MSPIRVFLSYRRDDARPLAERIYDRLVAHFGRTCVFKDVDSIPAGSHFHSRLKEALERCHVCLVVIGERWLDMRDRAGNRRLDDPADFVRLEIETALAHKSSIIPVLAVPARMPERRDLPQSLQELAFRQAIEIRPDPHFHRDVDELIRAIEKQAQSGLAETEAREARSATAGAQESLPRPLKQQAILDRRLATEVVVLFSQPDGAVPIDARLPRLLQFGVVLYDQLLIENQYGSTLRQVIREEQEVLRDSLCVLRELRRPEEDRDFLDMVADASDAWINDAQFQLAVARYDRKKGGALAAVEESVAYLQHALQLARRYDAALLPHPDRWPLFRWLFEHCLWAGDMSSSSARTVPLPADPADDRFPAPPERRDRVRRLAARSPVGAELSLALTRYGPMPYPFPPALLRRYDRTDLAAGRPFLYEFCAPAPATQAPEARSS